jgi:hypothetical protein
MICAMRSVWLSELEVLGFASSSIYGCMGCFQAFSGKIGMQCQFKVTNLDLNALVMIGWYSLVSK